MKIEDVNMRALKAVAMFAGADAHRPLLEGVQVMGDGLYVATNSYVMGMACQGLEHPAVLVERVIEASKRLQDDRKTGKPRDDRPLIPGKLIETSAKAGGTTLKGEWDILLDGSVVKFEHYDATKGIRFGHPHITMADRIEGEYPSVHSVLTTDQPSGAMLASEDGDTSGYGMSHEFVTTICKAGKLVGGENPLMLHGGVDNMKPCYWSIRGERETMVVLLMTCRAIGMEWGTAEAVGGKLKAVS